MYVPLKLVDRPIGGLEVSADSKVAGEHEQRTGMPGCHVFDAFC